MSGVHLCPESRVRRPCMHTCAGGVSGVVSVIRLYHKRFNHHLVPALRLPLCGADAPGSSGSDAVPVSFNIAYRTNFGQSLGLVGTHCNWDPQHGVRMTWQEGDWWTAQIELKPGWVWGGLVGRGRKHRAGDNVPAFRHFLLTLLAPLRCTHHYCMLQMCISKKFIVH